ncbi:arylformamidase [Crenobacter sp. SG2305]|uniref:arylformamidase n=1 Tax=Crenobacter oryzisoli TaxID=3056844 RepID=UPI0025AA50BF|nr:arylformamidase [Crenobacter sp. SG2305]MDN0083211.1 arylformamidase [Crenobacter sp. SG2305]
MLYDITPPLCPDMPVWPGDAPFGAFRTWSLSGACPVNVSRLSLSTHTGAHADAPLHYRPDGLAIGEVDLTLYLGPCRVLHCLDVEPLLTRAALSARLGDAPLPPRVLIRSYPRFPLEHWDDDFMAVAPEAIDWLGERGVRLIGTDTASLDPMNSKMLDAHHAVARHGMAILENLLLDEVPEGDYELIALPLKLMGVDASPVRAVLRPLN